MPTSPARHAHSSITQNPDTITASEYWGLLNQIYSKIRYLNDRARFDASIRDIGGALHSLQFITGWHCGDAMQAVETCFAAWL